MYGIARGVEFATSYARSIWKAPCPARSHGPDSSCCSGFGDVKCRPNCGRCWNSMNEFRLETDVSATRSTRWHSRAALVVTVNTSIGALTPRCVLRSEEHTSELQSLMRISYAVFCLKKKKTRISSNNTNTHNR